jgi:hypothetical protein
VARIPFPEACVDPLPDLKALSDAELRDLIDRLVAEEHEISYKRRLLHGKIDILKAELQARLQQQVGQEGESPLYEVDVDRLAAILASRAAPPNPQQ